jgi:hypothetical protein
MHYSNFLFSLLLFNQSSSYTQEYSPLKEAITANDLAAVMHACHIEKKTAFYKKTLTNALVYLDSEKQKKRPLLETVLDKECLVPAKIIDPAVLIFVITALMPSPKHTVIQTTVTQNKQSVTSSMNTTVLPNPNYITPLSLGGLGMQLGYNYYQCTKTKKEKSHSIYLYLQQELANNN